MYKLNWWNPFDWGRYMIDGAKGGIVNMLNEVFKDIILSSYWICLIGGVVGVILYIYGYEKGKKAPMLSIAIYMIINIIGRALLNG